MKAASVKDLKKELQQRSAFDLVALCLRLSKFKKENKELLSYLLFEADDENAFIRRIQEEMAEQFSSINTKSSLFIKKGVAKILRSVKTTIRYSSKKETEVELLLYFCAQMKEIRPSIKRNTVLQNLYERQLERIRKVVPLLHEDLQHDYTVELERL
ncbi:hypothetical protein [Haliscomenobacter hydrossis]|uniref:Uncharacterized protein n=1 Tax=Haliscomenobacter hydrossis (strain ATCC 27775 / DSM 1100 / LMG 10767 / O) TaxID=760192 RepID=F4KVA9_HALH1|nr:hypothetical protein [Haliscomenobacter hydrossis]AEE50235.1 hypothetical protein Halhy_2359 [Haliscomenobacter hydrossis DSM 1100]